MEPRAYLTKFYTEMDAGSQALMRFYSSVYRSYQTERMLEFGGGPALYSIISAAKCANLIHFTDYNSACLAEVQLWLQSDAGMFDWMMFVREALRCESGVRRPPSKRSILQREALIRHRRWVLSRCDAFEDDPLLGSGLGRYGIVATNFCLEGITNDRLVWKRSMAKLAALVADEGLLVTVSLAHASGWTVADFQGPAVYLELADLEAAYREMGFDINESRSVPIADRSHYDGFLMVCGRRLPAM